MKHYILVPLSFRVSEKDVSLKSRMIITGSSPISILLSSRKMGFLENMDSYDEDDDEDEEENEFERMNMPDTSGK